MHFEYEYRVSDRVVLKPGDRFRVRGGPFYRCPSGKVPLSAARTGPFQFVRVAVHKSRRVIEALDKHGSFAPLHVEGRRRPVCREIVPRPYRVVSRLRAPKSERAADEAAPKRRRRPAAPAATLDSIAPPAKED